MKNDYSLLGRLVWGTIWLFAVVIALPFAVLGSVAELFSAAR